MVKKLYPIPMVDLAKLILLLIGYTLYGSPDDWDKAWAIQLQVQYNSSGGVSSSLELSYDPVAIYYREFSGLKAMDNKPSSAFSMGAFVVVEPGWGADVDLRHEIEHIWQMRTWGLLMPITYALDYSLWEPNPYTWDNFNGMPSPRTLNWSLFKLWIPLIP